jgi:hypothetical protein
MNSTGAAVFRAAASSPRNIAVIAVTVSTISYSGQREILDALSTWDGAGLPGEVD